MARRVRFARLSSEHLDWEAYYINGNMVAEGRNINIMEIINHIKRALGEIGIDFQVLTMEFTEEEMESMGDHPRFPRSIE